MARDLRPGERGVLQRDERRPPGRHDLSLGQCPLPARPLRALSPRCAPLDRRHGGTAQRPARLAPRPDEEQLGQHARQARARLAQSDRLRERGRARPAPLPDGQGLGERRGAGPHRRHEDGASATACWPNTGHRQRALVLRGAVRRRRQTARPGRGLPHGLARHHPLGEKAPAGYTVPAGGTLSENAGFPTTGPTGISFEQVIAEGDVKTNTGRPAGRPSGVRAAAPDGRAASWRRAASPRPRPRSTGRWAGSRSTLVDAYVYEATQEATIKEKDLAKGEMFTAYFDRIIDKTTATELLHLLGYSGQVATYMLEVSRLPPGAEGDQRRGQQDRRLLHAPQDLRGRGAVDRWRRSGSRRPDDRAAVDLVGGPYRSRSASPRPSRSPRP